MKADKPSDGAEIPLRPSPERAWDVTHFSIAVCQVWNEMVLAQFRPDSQLAQTNGIPELSGEIGTTGDRCFCALVKWDCGNFFKGGVSLNGVVALRFTHNEGLPPDGVDYYCQVNAPILAYPYIREIVAHLTLGYPLGPVVLRPLDVPAFVGKAKGLWVAKVMESAKPEKESTGPEDESSRNGA
jgi:hypothetical protein